MAETNLAEVFKILGPTLVGSILTAFVTIVLQRRKEKRKREIEEKKEVKKRQIQKLDMFYEKLDFYLDATRNGFRNQRIERDHLVNLLEKNHDLDQYLSDDHEAQPYKEWGYKHDEMFEALYPKMNEDERYLFDLIRGITEKTLFTYNSKIVQLLDEYSQFHADVPEMKLLHENLNFWLAKYEATFRNKKEMCLVYVGTKDGKPFPKGIRKIVAEKIKQLKEQQI